MAAAAFFNNQDRNLSIIHTMMRATAQQTGGEQQSTLLLTSMSRRLAVPERSLQQSNNDNNSFQHFVAFSTFIALALGSVLLTYCIHRRRRSFEARRAMEEQENAMDEHQWQNIGHFKIVNELVQAERARLLLAQLKPTTMVITAGDLAQLQDDDNLEVSAVANEGQVVATEGTGNVAEKKDKTTTSELAAVSLKGGDSSDDNMYDVEMGIETSFSALDMERSEFLSVVRLPSSLPTAGSVDEVSVSNPTVNGDRCVPGVCTICFRSYKVGEQLTWSKRQACRHAFHTECIIPWLAKKELPECPVCRQMFCDPQQVFFSPISKGVFPQLSSTLQPPPELTDHTLESAAITPTILDRDNDGTTTDISIAAPLEYPCSQPEHSTIQHHDTSVTPIFLDSPRELSERITVPEEGIPLSSSPGLRRSTSCSDLSKTSSHGSTTNAALVRSNSLVVLP